VLVITSKSLAAALLSLFCSFGLLLELSKGNSVVGWQLRNVYNYFSYDTSVEGVLWKNGTLVVNENDLDVIVRTVIGEAALEPDEGKIAVIWVIMNRAVQNVSWYGGNNVADVSLHKSKRKTTNGRTITTWQFEPWMSRKDDLWDISKDSKLYKHVRSLAIGCFSSKFNDPTNGATHFLEPTIVTKRREEAGLGSTLPEWARGSSNLKVGNHVFFRPKQ
jgi:Cell Wall Hydrolase